MYDKEPAGMVSLRIQFSMLWVEGFEIGGGGGGGAGGVRVVNNSKP